jgi:hypothetical protein
MISNKNDRAIRPIAGISIAKKSAIATIFLAMTLTLTNSQADELRFSNETHRSTLERIDEAEEKYKARVIRAKRKAKPGFPNCHELKMKTSSGVFKIVRVHCS